MIFLKNSIQYGEGCVRVSSRVVAATWVAGGSGTIRTEGEGDWAAWTSGLPEVESFPFLRGRPAAELTTGTAPVTSIGLKIGTSAIAGSEGSLVGGGSERVVSRSSWGWCLTSWISLLDTCGLGKQTEPEGSEFCIIFATKFCIAEP